MAPFSSVGILLACSVVILALPQPPLARKSLLCGAVIAARRGDRAKVVRWALPPVICLLVFQWQSLGGPLHTGAASFSLHYVTHASSSGVVRHGVPNFIYYPGILVGRYVDTLPPVLPVLGFIEAWRRRRTPEGTIFRSHRHGQFAHVLPYLFRD